MKVLLGVLMPDIHTKEIDNSTAAVRPKKQTKRLRKMPESLRELGSFNYNLQDFGATIIEKIVY